MAYARKHRKRSTRHRSKSRVAAPPAKKTTKSYVRKNAYKIADCKRDIAFLKMARYGSVQINFQKTDRTLIPTKTRPVLFDMMDFTCRRAAAPPAPASSGCLCYQYNALGTGVIAASTWHINSSLAANPYWLGQNRDIPDTGKYLPLSAYYTFRVEGNAALDNTRVRLQVFSVKPRTYVPNSAASQNLVLPTAMNNLESMANPVENRLSRVHFKCYADKWLFINSTKTNDDTKGTTANILYKTIHINPKKKRLRTQAVTNPETSMDPDAEFPDGNFGPLNCPITDPLWCLISTDDESALLDSVEVTISRRVVFRDPIGMAPLR